MLNECLQKQNMHLFKCHFDVFTVFFFYMLQHGAPARELRTFEYLTVTMSISDVSISYVVSYILGVNI